MKKMMVLLALVLSFNMSASHLLGGMITVAQTSQDSTSVGVYLISDSQGILPSTIYVERWDMNFAGWYTYNTSAQTIQLTLVDTMMHQGNIFGTYSSNYLDLDSNKYRFVYRNCCWGMLGNSNNSINSEFIISADYWHIPNNSTPQMENPLWMNYQYQTTNTMKSVWGIFNCFFTNPDTDSVSIENGDLYMGHANNVFVPQNYASIDSFHVSNDSISWWPQYNGLYGVGIEIKDYRNGQLIGTQRLQWTFRVYSSTVGIEEDIVYRDTQYSVYDWNGRYMGDNINWSELKGLYVIRYNNGKIEKIFCN